MLLATQLARAEGSAVAYRFAFWWSIGLAVIAALPALALPALAPPHAGRAARRAAGRSAPGQGLGKSAAAGQVPEH